MNPSMDSIVITLTRVKVALGSILHGLYDGWSSSSHVDDSTMLPNTSDATDATTMARELGTTGFETCSKSTAVVTNLIPVRIIVAIDRTNQCSDTPVVAVQSDFR